ncbi:MAG TPA: hypothetical protein VMY77_06035 [Chitinophagaceae bacterium]|nr:hypothetical protein [Chitinophagaceae bacterium]
MKLLSVLLLFSLSINAQKLPADKDGRITFSGVTEVPGLSQIALRIKAKKIISNTFSAAPGNKIVESQGSLMFKGYAFYHLNKIGVELPYFFNFTLQVSFEDGRFTYITTDFVDDENIPLEKGLLNAKNIYNDKGEVKPEMMESFNAITKGLKNIGESFKSNMIDSLSP